MYRKGVTLVELVLVMGMMATMTACVIMLDTGMSELQYYDSFKEYNHNVIKAIQQLDQDNPHHDVSLYSTDVLNKSGLLKDPNNSNFHFLGTQKDGSNSLILRYSLTFNKGQYVQYIKTQLTSKINDEVKAYPVHNLKFVEHITVDGKKETILSYKINDKEVK